jgi:hypothetical protein
MRPLVEEANDLAGNVLASCLLVVHYTSRGSEHDVSELTGRQQLDDPLLELGQADVVPGGDNASLVETIITESQHQLSMEGGGHLYRPFNCITILPERWSSTSSNSPM